MDRWHEKHPLPWDFFNTYNNVSGKDLNWFWINWFFSNYYIDLSISSVTKINEGYTINIKNIGGMDAPFDLLIKYNDGSSEKIHYTPLIWQLNQEQTTIKMNAKKKITEITLEGGIFMDANESNNKWVQK
jgi:hypothetical protein